MEIKKVLGLSSEEFNALIKAGEILGGINKAIESKDADELSEESKKLVAALADIVSKIIK